MTARRTTARTFGLVLVAALGLGVAAVPIGADGEEHRRSPRRSAYARGWSAVHADGANSDRAVVRGASDVTQSWRHDFGGTINLGPTIDPTGRVYVTSTGGQCHLYVLDGRTGEQQWCSTEVDRLAVVSSPLLDRQGRSFLADGSAMHAFDRDGRLLWETPIVGVPLSAQFTPEGRLIFVTNIGRIYMLRRDTGASVMHPVELIPGATFDPATGVTACARGTEACPSANTPAVDLAARRLIFTFWAPGADHAGVRAMRINERGRPSVTPLWTNDELPGGTASSPTLSRDGSRVYVTDNGGSLRALDTATGRAIWAFPIGYNADGSASVSRDGLVMPAGGSLSPLVAVSDLGRTARLAWRAEALGNRGIATQARGFRAYATIRTGPLTNDLVVVDTRTGEELDREPMAGSTIFSVGTTIGLDGTVFVPTILGSLFAFRPAARG